MKKGFTLIIVLLFLTQAILLHYTAPGTSSDQTYTPILSTNYVWQKQPGYPSGTAYNQREWSSPLVVDGVVYVGATTTVNCYPFYITPPPGHDCEWWSDFYALNASDGAVIWDFKDDSLLIREFCAFADGLVFFSAAKDVNQFGDANSLLAFNATNGALVWNHTTQSFMSSPVVGNGIVYVTIGPNFNGALYAFDAANGNKLWDAPGYSATLPVIDEGIVYVGSMSNGPNANGEFIPSYAINALDAKNGRFLWNYSTNFWVSNPVVFEKIVFFSADNNIIALNAITGDKLWNCTITSDTNFHPECHLPSVKNGVVYVTSSIKGGVIALRAFDGVELWTHVGAFGNPVVIDKGVAYVNIKGYISSLNAYNGHKIWDSTLSSHNWNMIPSRIFAFDKNVMYYSFGYDLFSAVELPELTPQSNSPNTLYAFTDQGETIKISITGALTSSEITNAYLTTDQKSKSTYLYFNVDSAKPSKGFSNITLPKILIPDGTSPTIYVDDEKAENQGYTQDTTNYYVWYTTDLSRNQISIIFKVPQDLAFSFTDLIWIGTSILTISLIIIGLLVYLKKHQKQVNSNFSCKTN